MQTDAPLQQEPTAVEVSEVLKLAGMADLEMLTLFVQLEVAAALVGTVVVVAVAHLAPTTLRVVVVVVALATLVASLVLLIPQETIKVQEMLMSQLGMVLAKEVMVELAVRVATMERTALSLLATVLVQKSLKT